MSLGNNNKLFFGNRLTVAVVVLVLCFSSVSIARSEAPAFKYNWKYATLAGRNKSAGWCKHVRQTLEPLIDDQSKGKVGIKTYWGGVLGDDEDILKKMRSGHLNGAGLSAQGCAQAIPEMAVVELPFLFRDYDEVDYIRDKLLPTFDSLAEKRGYLIIAWIDQDFDQMYSTKYTFSRVEDFSKAGTLSWCGPMEESFVSLMGVSPIPVDVVEIPSAFRSEGGTSDPECNTIIAPAIWVVDSQLYNNFRYINTTKIRYSPALIIQNLSDFQGSPEVETFRKILMEKRDDYTRRMCAGIREDNQKYIDALIKYGITKTEFSQEAVLEMKRRTKFMWMNNIEKLYPKELLDQVLLYLGEYRSAQLES